MATVDDPYFSAHLADKTAPGKRLGAPERPPVLAWAIVYVANLIVPIYFGYLLTRGAGRIGMLIGTLVVFAAGCRACLASRWAMLAVVYGGWVVAVSQFYPFLQVFSGFVGFAAVGAIGLGKMPGGGPSELDTVLAGLTATIVTSGVLLGVATILGLAIRWIRSWFVRRGTLGPTP